MKSEKVKRAQRELAQTWTTAALLLLHAQGGGSIEVPLDSKGQVAMLEAIPLKSVRVVDDLDRGMRTITLSDPYGDNT